MKLPQVFLPQHLALVSLRDFVKLIVGAFFIFLIKMSWKKKKDFNCQPGAGGSPSVQPPC